MGTNCAPLVSDLFLFCYERDFMMSLSDDKQGDVIDAFNSTSRYLDDILDINNVYFDNIVSQIYPLEIQLNKAKAFDIPLFHTGPETHELTRIDKYLDLWLNRTQFVKVLTDSHSP